MATAVRPRAARAISTPPAQLLDQNIGSAMENFWLRTGPARISQTPGSAYSVPSGMSRWPGSRGTQHGPFGTNFSLIDLHPVQRALDRLTPAGVTARAPVVGPRRMPAPGFVPVGAQLTGVPPEPGGQAGRVGGAQRGGLGHDRAADRNAEDVGLQLHGQVVGGHPAVHLEHLEPDPG